MMTQEGFQRAIRTSLRGLVIGKQGSKYGNAYAKGTEMASYEECNQKRWHERGSYGGTSTQEKKESLSCEEAIASASNSTLYDTLCRGLGYAAYAQPAGVPRRHERGGLARRYRRELRMREEQGAEVKQHGTGLTAVRIGGPLPDIERGRRSNAVCVSEKRRLAEKARRVIMDAGLRVGLAHEVCVRREAAERGVTEVPTVS
ncbi:hypothetical protein Tco_0278646 [Tanacetum coccineum]